MNLSSLYSAEPPWLLIDAVSEDDEKLLASVFYRIETRRPVIRVLRGEKMATRQDLMDQFGAALQFFEGFGENWHALKDCLSYMDEWLAGDAFILVVTRPELLLGAATEEDLHWFTLTMQEVGEWWSQPVTDNARFNRGSVPFHVVLRCRPSALSQVKQRFPSAGLLLTYEGRNERGEVT